MFTEGFNSAITAVEGNNDGRNSVLVLNFRGVPEGVTVTASLTGEGAPMEDDMSDLAALNLVTGGYERR